MELNIATTSGQPGQCGHTTTRVGCVIFSNVTVVDSVTATADVHRLEWPQGQVSDFVKRLNTLSPVPSSVSFAPESQRTCRTQAAPFRWCPVLAGYLLCGLLAGLAGGCAIHDDGLLNPEPLIVTDQWQDRNGLDSRVTVSQPVAEYGGTNLATTASYHYPPTPWSAMDPLIAANYRAADKLVENLGMPGQRYRSLLVTSFVNTDQPEQSPALSRVLGEQVASRLTQLGYTVVEEFKTGDTNYRKQPAEIRPWSARTPGFQHGVQAVVAGTYAVAQDRVFINVRLIDAASNIPVSAYDYAVPLNGATLALITGCMRQGRWICRLP